MTFSSEGNDGPQVLPEVTISVEKSKKCTQKINKQIRKIRRSPNPETAEHVCSFFDRRNEKKIDIKISVGDC